MYCATDRDTEAKHGVFSVRYSLNELWTCWFQSVNVTRTSSSVITLVLPEILQPISVLHSKALKREEISQ